MNFFKDIVTDMDNVEKEFLGPDYNYTKFINSPKELGMSGKGSMGALEKDVAGIVSYVELLIAGTGEASKSGKPLGDRFFLKTGGKCKDYKTSKLVQRDMYINNVPDGQIPILSELSGIDATSFEGLIPGIFSNLDALNPLQLFSAFMEGNNPLCAEVKLETIGSNNRKKTEAGYVPISELKQLESSNDIPKGTVTSQMNDALKSHVKENTEGFININDVSDYKKTSKKKYKVDKFLNKYFFGICILFLYILYRVLNKE